MMPDQSAPEGGKPEKGANNTAIYLIDASVYVFRAWFSIPSSVTDATGHPINALHGFAGFIVEFLRRTNATRVAFAFDESLTSSFRNEIDPDYKANRESAPEELKQQFSACRELVAAMGMLSVAHERYEADDYIATFAAAARAENLPCTILSRDKDLTQLVDPRTRMWDFAGDVVWDEAAVEEKFGIPPAAMVDYQALVGDSVDNIPGVRGVGPKAAAALLGRFGSLQSLYDNLDEVSQMPLRGARRIASLLEEQRDQAWRCRELVTLLGELPAEAMPDGWGARGLELLTRRACDTAVVQRCCQNLGLGPGMQRRIATALQE